jgi:hypothetical protein
VRTRSEEGFPLYPKGYQSSGHFRPKGLRVASVEYDRLKRFCLRGTNGYAAEGKGRLKVDQKGHEKGHEKGHGMVSASEAGGGQCPT